MQPATTNPLTQAAPPVGVPVGWQWGWDRPVAGWVWVFALLVCVLVALWSYRGLTGNRNVRALLAGVRAMLLFGLLVLLAGPRLESPRERVEHDQVLVLVDRSVSMTIADASGADITREDQLTRAASETENELSKAQHDTSSRVIRWLGFGSGVFELQENTEKNTEKYRTNGDTPSPLWTVDIGQPTQLHTRIDASLSQALDLASGRPIAGVVLLSDGKSADAPSAALLGRLEADRVPVYVVPLGSADPTFDIAIVDVTAPSLAYIDDDVPVRVRLLQIGSSAPERITRGDVVRIVDASNGRVLAETQLSEGMFEGESEFVADVSLTIRNEDVGRRLLRVQVRTSAGDLSDANNTMDLPIEFVDEPIRVLHLDGGPRWEQRYLRELLVRESSIESASLQLSTGKRYIREGNLEIASIPSSPEEWARFDVVIIGDVRPELFTENQLVQLRESVASRGTGLLWTAGPSSTPHAWAQTPLADCLPITLTSEASHVPRFSQDVVMRRTATAARLGLLDMADSVHPGTVDDPGWPARLSEKATGWSRLRWAMQIDNDQLKPAAEVLAVVEPVGGAPDDVRPDARPLVVSMRFGSGQVVFVGTDEIWRWRFGRGETLPERFWIPIIRSQARERLSSVGRGVTFRVAPSRAYVDQLVRLELRLTDQRLLDLRPEKIAVQVQRYPSGATSSQAPRAERIDLVPENMSTTGSNLQSSVTFAQTWVPRKPGRHTITVIEPSLSGRDLSVDIDVRTVDDELADPETNHQLLVDLAEQTDGAVLSASDVSALSQLPNRSRRIALAPDTTPLWDRWWVLAIFLGLLLIEWVGRKMLSLV